MTVDPDDSQTGMMPRTRLAVVVHKRSEVIDEAQNRAPDVYARNVYARDVHVAAPRCSLHRVPADSIDPAMEAVAPASWLSHACG
jgi:hypothetical protein